MIKIRKRVAWLLLIMIFITFINVGFTISSLILTKDTKSIAHRGFGIFNKNTISSFKLSKSFDGIECDIWMTSDKKFIVSHYDEIKTRAGEKISISENSFEFIKINCDNIILFEDYLDCVKKLNKTPVIDIKSRNLTLDDAKVIINIIKEFNLDNAIILSYSQNVILYFKDLTTYELHYVFNSDKESNFQFCIDYNINACASYKVVDADVINQMHKNNLKVNVWTINDIFQYLYYASIGADYITSDLLS